MPSGPTEPTAQTLRCLLAAALRGEAAPWPAPVHDGHWSDALLNAVIYHGVAGLMADSDRQSHDWPASLLDDLRCQARAEAMWELRHREILSRLLAGLAGGGIRALVMKGSALAYDLYHRPAARPRGDTDLLVLETDVPAARRLLADLGYQPYAAGGSLEWLQEGWTLRCADGSRHSIDLHWSALNAQALAQVLPVAECLANARPLPALGRPALQMDRVRMLLHLCVHRALHVTAPYLVGDEAYFGADRLIWSFDLYLLAGDLDPADWDSFLDLAAGRRVAGTCLDGLEAAERDFRAVIPQPVLAALKKSAANDLTYLRSRSSMAREWRNLRAMPGIGLKTRYLVSRLFPESRTLRGKYPGMGGMPLPLLHLRRIAGALRRRDGKAVTDQRS